MPTRGISYSSHSFNSLFAALLRRSRTRAAARLFHLMLRLGVQPNAVTFNTLIRGFCLNSMVPEAFQIFRLMPRHRCTPDIITYNTLLDGLLRAGNFAAARSLFEVMRNRSAELAPNIVSYTTLIRGYCSQLMVAEAVAFWDEMVALGLKPNEVTFNTLMKGFSEARRFDLMKQVFDEQAGFKPDICTFNTLIAAHCTAGNTSDALKVFDELTELKLKPDSATYSTLIRALCSIKNFQRAEELADELLENKILRRADASSIPLMAAYNPLFQHLCSCRKTEKAEKVLRELIEAKATADPAAFKTIILGYCREDLFEKGYKLLVLMVMRELKPDYDSCLELLKGFISKGNICFASETLKRALDGGHRLNTEYFHSVLTGLSKKNDSAHEAADLISVMLERKIRQNIDLSTDVVAKLFQCGSNERAFGIARSVYDSGYRLKMEKLVRVLCQQRRFSEGRGLLLLSLEKKESLNSQVVCMVVNGLCEIGGTSEAFDLFYNVIGEDGDWDISSCFNTLRLALQKAGMLKEAEFVSKKISRTKVA